MKEAVVSKDNSIGKPSTTPDVVASLDKTEWGESKVIVRANQDSPVSSPELGMNGKGPQYLAATQILEAGRSSRAYYQGADTEDPQSAAYSTEYGMTTSGLPIDPYSNMGTYHSTYGYTHGGYQITYDQAALQGNYMENGTPAYYGPTEYPLETQRLVGSSDRMSYQSSQQSDSNGSTQSESKKFVHFSEGTAVSGFNNGYKGPPPPVPPKPAYGPADSTRLNESHCSVNSVDQKKVRTVTQV
jgi:hypothetical protein